MGVKEREKERGQEREGRRRGRETWEKKGDT
jgi:hypothetical protein